MYIKKRIFKTWEERYAEAKEKGIQLIGDKAIREAVIQSLNENFKNKDILKEVKFPGFTADLLMLKYDKTDSIVGIEIKSDRDSLSRLESQLQGYLTYCNSVFVATTMAHKAGVEHILKKEKFQRVGLLIYTMTDTGNYMSCVKPVKRVDVKGLSTVWVTKKHQLYSYEYFLKMMWE